MNATPPPGAIRPKIPGTVLSAVAASSATAKPLKAHNSPLGAEIREDGATKTREPNEQSNPSTGTLAQSSKKVYGYDFFLVFFVFLVFFFCVQ